MAVARTTRRLLAALAAVAVTLVALAGPAAAHAELEATDPVSGAVLDTPPSTIALKFSEPVEVSLGGIRLFDAGGGQVDVGPPERVAGDATSIQVALADIGEGSFAVSWRVTSADGHPITGAFTFQVGQGQGADTRALVADLIEGSTTDEAVDTGLTLARGMTYAGLAALIGGLVAIALVWPAGAERVGARRLLWGGWGLALVGTLVAFALQGPYATGQGLGQALDTGLWSSVIETRSGKAALAGAAVLAIAAPVLLGTLRRCRERAWRGAGAAFAVVVALTVATAGHSGAERWAGVGLVADVIHVLAMAVWLGGLAMLGILAVADRAPAGELAPAPVARSVGAAGAADLAVRGPAGGDDGHDGDGGAGPERGDDGREPDLERFSGLARAALVALVVTGLVQAWRLVGGVDALVSTTYGRTLLVKTALVAVMAGLALASRRALARRDRRSLRLFMRDEVAFGVGILAVTAVLTGTPPAQVEEGKPVSVALVEQSVIADITVDPAAAGRPNEMHVYLTPPGGSLSPVESIEVRFTLADRELGPMPVQVDRAGPNHWVASGFVLPYPGDWQLEILAQLSQFEQIRLSTVIPVR